jgi:hypothetical protein
MKTMEIFEGSFSNELLKVGISLTQPILKGRKKMELSRVGRQWRNMDVVLTCEILITNSSKNKCQQHSTEVQAKRYPLKERQ